jgi:hypothetical protein
MNGETESEKPILGCRKKEKKKDNRVGKREVDKSKQKTEHGRNAKTEKEKEKHAKRESIRHRNRRPEAVPSLSLQISS